MEDCIFCKIVTGEIPSAKIMETEHAYAFLDINPMAPYHTLVIPKGHYKDIFDITEEALTETMLLVRRVCKLYEEKLGIRNVQIVNNSGAEAQQEVFHIHFHICPRKAGDGQTLRHKNYPELRAEFGAMLEKLK